MGKEGVRNNVDVSFFDYWVEICVILQAGRMQNNIFETKDEAFVFGHVESEVPLSESNKYI